MSAELVVTSDDQHLVFGGPRDGIAYVPRPASHAVVLGERGRFAFVRSARTGELFLIGGGAEAGETPEQTLTREAREECAREIEISERIGDVLQYFVVEDVYYEMRDTFFAARLGESVAGTPELDLVWLTLDEAAPQMFHECHIWAVREYERRFPRTDDRRPTTAAPSGGDTRP